ncbi:MULTISPECIES: response regulator [Bordetella]|uniref:Response regulator n=2 Tax=Bordetella TaxID=517 RepID=A0A261VWY8_9BORD|nr:MULTISPECIES: response regulator [Bordetella]MDM9560204.1 response regulator [Bordetella petrii]OZI78301.1 response regulator [Bordetella genomosp. 2]
MTATILVVDDSATMRMIVQAALGAAGWRVLTAGDGRQALELARGDRIDLLVSDWNMPVMDGLALIQELRAEPGYQELPVLVLTTEQAAQSKDAARGLGVCGWLNKPVEPDVLVELAAELLGEQPAA